MQIDHKKYKKETFLENMKKTYRNKGTYICGDLFSSKPQEWDNICSWGWSLIYTCPVRPLVLHWWWWWDSVMTDWGGFWIWPAWPHGWRLNGPLSCDLCGHDLPKYTLSLTGTTDGCLRLCGHKKSETKGCMQGASGVPLTLCGPWEIFNNVLRGNWASALPLGSIFRL